MKIIKLFDIASDKKEQIAAQKTLQSKFWASGSGTGNVLKFENKLQKSINSKTCICVNSGTAALHLALSLFDIKNKEVILPSLSFVSTAHAIVYNGGIPKFVDIDPKTLLIDPHEIENSITKKTKLILPVHLAGLACNLNHIKKICKNNSLSLVEDAAHAVGTQYKGKKIGTHGDAVCFSFHPIKNLSMPSGGAIALNGKNWKTQKSSLYTRRWCGISNRKHTSYDVNELGWNYYMNEIEASIGLVQLQKLQANNLKRKKTAFRYYQELNVENRMPYDKDCSYHFYWIRVKNRKQFMKNLHEFGIETGIHYRPIHTFKFYSESKKLPLTDVISNEIVSLPTHPNLTENDINKIIKITNTFSK